MSADQIIAIHEAQRDGDVALCASVALPSDEGAPDWVHLLPAGTIRTGDGRGPYTVGDAGALIATSLPAGERLPIDENHATDLAAPHGQPAPARGWIVQLQARQDGVWGRVDWTAHGERLVKGRAYRGISPVIQHRKDGTVTAILRASLVNKPNLRGLTALHQETSKENGMTLLEKLIKALGLEETTSEDALVSRVTAMAADAKKEKTATQAVLAPIARAAGLAEDAGAEAVLAGVAKLADEPGGGDDVVTALQAELKDVTEKLNAVTETTARDKATAFIDGAIKAGRVGVKPMRDRYIAMHMKDAAECEALIGAMPVLGGGGALVPQAEPAKDGEIALQAEQRAVAKMLGIDAKDFAATLKAERAEQEEAL